MKKRLHHVNFRLTEKEYGQLLRRAENNCTTISEEVRKAMNDTIHQIQTERLSMSAVMYRDYQHGLRIRTLDVKIDAQTYEYIKLNVLNITSVLRYNLAHEKD